ncbi:hypothetical protein [Actinomadura chibensis]|uniref:Uncharacterized protein n=1 Tax=Actinomadura chibensis TaxID=392828 RepID=A0A5D0NUE7_9ACTN|nr:hypothetical protein [Actinomadura chibensis]TYB47798.1 hypothetical protein FXF69_00630 [Actinomadura chibensis]
MTRPDPRHKPLLTPRTALVLLLAVLSGIGAGLLALAADHGAAESIMTGCGAAAAGVPFFDQLITEE